MSNVITDDRALENIQSNVTSLLQRKGLSQADLARKTGENEMYISRICRGKMLPNAAALARIAEALGVSSERLLESWKNS